MRRLAALAVAAILLVACGGTSPAPGSGVAKHAHGDPIEAPRRPSDAECDTRLRSEQGAAARIRTNLHTDGIRNDVVAVKAAAADPTASTAALGIPLAAGEQLALKRSGIDVDGATSIAFWVNVGASERFGGIWADPSGSTHSVAIVGGDPETLLLARCLERVDTRYVWANLSIADGRAKGEAIGRDMEALRASGIEINSVGYREEEGNVVVGVTHPSSQLEKFFVDRYGSPLRLEEEGPSIID